MRILVQMEGMCLQYSMLHNHRQATPFSLTIYVFLFSFLLATSSKYISLSVQTSSTQINLPSTYNFILNRQIDPVNNKFNATVIAVPSGTTIVITLPSQFIDISTNATLPCINAATTQALTCSVNVPAKTITVTDYYSTNGTLSNGVIQINVYNLINAYKAGASDNFYWAIIAPNGTTIDNGPLASNTQVMTSIIFTPATFQSCSITANGATVSSYSPITLTLVPSDPIPASGQLVVVIPLTWSSDPLQTTTINVNPTCTGVTNTGSSVTCTYITSPVSQIITVSGLSSNSIFSSFSISISSVLIPPTVGSSETISMYSQWPDGTSIDTCSSTISGITVVRFQSATLTSNDNTTVQSAFTASLHLVISRDFYYQDSIELQMPDELANCNIASTTFATFTKTVSLNVLTLTNFPSLPTSFPANNKLAFTLSNINNPLSTAPISLVARIYRNNQLYQQQTVTYSATAGTVGSFSISADSNFVQTVGRTTFTITSSLKFPINSTIYVVYPITITAETTNSSSVNLATLNGSVVAGVTYKVANNQIQFSNLFSSTFSGTVVLIIGAFTNPPTVQPTTYLLQVYDQSAAAVMSGSTVLTASTKALLSNSISTSSYQVLQTGVTYTATFTSNFAFTSVSIIVPADITILPGFQGTCAPSSFSSCALAGNNLTFSGTLPASSYQLKWGYVTNPSSFSPTSSFQIYTYSKGFGVENSQGVLSVAMNSTASLSNLILFPSSYNNSAPITVTLLLTFPSGTPAGQLAIKVPSDLVATSATCTGCTVSSPNIYLSLSAGTPNASVVISNIKNVGSYKQVGAFTVALTSNTGFASLSSSIAGWTNNYPSSFATAVSGNNNYRGETNNFKFVLSGLSGAQSYAVVAIDSSFGALSNGSANSYSLQVGCTGTACSFNFNIVNPTVNGSYVFTLTTFTNDSYTVGTSTSNIWMFDCFASNCRSCLANGSCISCYNSSISSFYILNTFTSTCDRDCNSGYFRINSTCAICDSNCSQCVNTNRTCTSCPNGYFLDTTYLLCVPVCLSGYFANALSQTCTLCTQPCATCSGTSNYCLSCVVNSYLLGSDCRPTCPTNQYIANAVTLKCDACSPNCLTCVNTTAYCLSCNNTIGLYFQNNVCVTNCSSNYFIVNSICTYCQLPCKLCSGATNVCASCFLNSTNPVYFNQTCISALQCPVGHYVNSTNSSCELCPSSCLICSSSNVCSSCSLGYYLYGTLCISSCPNTTYFTSNSSTGLCQLCNSCATCNSSTACTTCIASQFLYNAVCYSTCPNGSFPIGSICSACSSNCPTCQNTTYCTSCVTSMNLYKGGCYLVCPNSTFANTTQQLCVNCPASCATCTSASVCQNCISNHSLQNSQCVLICSQGLSFNQMCYPCGLNCDICSNATCSLCSASYYLYNNTCLSKCPSNMLSLDSIGCVLCTNKFFNCSTCTLVACLTCTYGQLANGTCIPCSAGSYAESGACTTCPSTCATCQSQTACTTCQPSHYLLGGQCSSACPLNMVPNGTSCSVCLANCSICNQANSLCSVCSAGLYLYNNLCFSNCPSPLIPSYDFLTCVTEAAYFEQFSKAAKIVPFPFTIGALTLVIIGVILKCFHKEMHLQTVLCAIVSIVEIGSWVIFLGFQYIYLSNFHKLSLYNLACAAVGVALLVLLDFIHLKFYCKYIRADSEFVKWVRKNGCANGSMLGVATTLNFKFYRLIHSKLLGREETSMVLSSPNKLTPFSMISLISILTCSVPVFVGCALALYNSISQDQEFFIALDTITVTGIMILLILMDLRHTDDYFVDEHEAKNLKKKVYEQDEIKFDGDFNNPLEDNVSHEQLMHVQEDQGEMALPPSATKFQSTFQKTNRKQAEEPLPVQSKILGPHEEIGSEENICEQQVQESEQSIAEVKGAKWQQKQYDHYGYLIKYDANNNQVKYDENGHRVEIGQDGKHRKYNEQGHQMIMVNGKLVPHDKDGYRIINGKRYDHRGYEIREEDGQLVAYDQNGFKVVGEAPNEKHIDQNGFEVVVDENGKLRRYQADGWEVVDVDGKRLLKNKLGQCVRLNDKGEWEAYDPQDGFALRLNPLTGRYDKYNDLGFRVERDKYGNLHYYDEDGFQVTILPGGEIVRHDGQGYRIEKDSEGKVHRFDEDDYELVNDEKGNPIFIDKHGYRVERDLYGRPTLFDKEGLQVRIDPITGQHRRFNEQGLEVVTDAQGNRKLVDKRGRIVRELPQGFEKYDEQGNKVWLNDDGYEVEEDTEGNVNRYDKVGDRVDTQYEIQQFDQQNFQGNLMINTNKKPPKYKFKPNRQVDQEAELDQLISAPQIVDFEEEEEEISELQEFHDSQFPPQRDVTHEFDRLVDRERSQLLFREEAGQGLEDLKEFQHKEELYGHLVEPNADLQGLLPGQLDPTSTALPNETQGQRELDGELPMRSLDKNQPTGLVSQAQMGNRSLEDHQLNRHSEFDQEFAIRDLDGKEPPLKNRPLQGTSGLPEGAAQQDELDEKFTMQPLDAREPALSNRALGAHRQLGDRERDRQGEYDQEAYVREIDDNEPDIIEIRRRDAERAQIARKKAMDRNLGVAKAQQEIQIRSVADVSINQMSFENEGVQPLQNRTDFDEINSLDQLEVPLGRKQRGNRSEVSLVNNKKATQTVYNYNTVAVEIKNQNPLYDEDEEIESLHEEDWQEQLNPMVFSRRVKEQHTSNANTNILFVDEGDNDDNDALTDLIHQSETKPNPNSHRYKPTNDMLSRESIEQAEEQLFRQARQKEIRQRREFRLSGAPNPLVEYAKTIEANKKSLQEKMYFQSYKR